jgi:hypothetical protein
MKKQQYFSFFLCNFDIYLSFVMTLNYHKMMYYVCFVNNREIEENQKYNKSSLENLLFAPFIAHCPSILPVDEKVQHEPQSP